MEIVINPHTNIPEHWYALSNVLFPNMPELNRRNFNYVRDYAMNFLHTDNYFIAYDKTTIDGKEAYRPIGFLTYGNLRPEAEHRYKHTQGSEPIPIQNLVKLDGVSTNKWLVELFVLHQGTVTGATITQKLLSAYWDKEIQGTSTTSIHALDNSVEDPVYKIISFDENSTFENFFQKIKKFKTNPVLLTPETI